MTNATATCPTVEARPFERLPAGERPVDRYAHLPGLRVHYQDYGGDGRPIVLLHGLASSSLIWGMVGPQLAKTNRVVALDQRGHGLTEKPATRYDFATVTGDLASFVDQLGFRRPVIVGHSWGAHVALEYAARHPERVGAVVLVDGGVEALDGRSWDEVERELAPPDLTHLTQPELVAQVREWDWGQFWNDHVQATLLSLFDVARDCTVRPRLDWANHLRILRAVWEQQLEDIYPRVRRPVLIVPASDGADSTAADPKREKVGRALGLLSSAEVRWFDDSTHDLPLQRPHELAAVVGEFANRDVK